MKKILFVIFLIPLSALGQTATFIYSDLSCTVTGATTVPASTPIGVNIMITPTSMNPNGTQPYLEGMEIEWERLGANKERTIIHNITGTTFTTTTTKTHAGGSTIGTYCFGMRYASPNDGANDPEALIYPGGGWANWNDGCTGVSGMRTVPTVNICPLIQQLVQSGRQVYVAGYPFVRDGDSWPGMIQQAKAILSGLASGAPWARGNPNDIIILGSSAGGQPALLGAMTPKGKWLTDGNGNSPYSSTAWTITGIFCNSCLTDLPTLYGATPSCGTLGCPTFNNAFGGGSTPSNQVQLDASPTSYIACAGCWNGSFPIINMHSVNDATITPASEDALNTAAIAAGYTTVNLTYDLVHGVTSAHTLDHADSNLSLTSTNMALSYASVTGTDKCTSGAAYVQCGPLGVSGAAVSMLTYKAGSTVGGVQ